MITNGELHREHRFHGRQFWLTAPFLCSMWHKLIKLQWSYESWVLTKSVYFYLHLDDCCFLYVLLFGYVSRNRSCNSVDSAILAVDGENPDLGKGVEGVWRLADVNMFWEESSPGIQERPEKGFLVMWTAVISYLHANKLHILSYFCWQTGYWYLDYFYFWVLIAFSFLSLCCYCTADDHDQHKSVSST